MKWLAAIGVAFPLLVVIAIQMIPAPAMVQAEEFDNAWNDTMADDPAPTEEQKRDAIRGAFDLPRLVKTERIILDPKPEEPADVDWDERRKFMHRTFKATRQQLADPPEDAPPPVVKRRRHVNRDDFCARHKMQLVQTGKTWRCRK